MPAIAPISGACVWRGADMATSSRWHRHLSPAQLVEIDTALAAVRGRDDNWESITAANFPVPSFAALADDIREELE
jgi:hypothetical protein